MKKTIVILLGIFLSMSMIAQNKKADEIIDKVSSKANSFESFKIDFIFEMVSPDSDAKDVNKGTLFVKGEKYQLDIAGQLVICDGETIWTYLKDADEVQINTVEEEEGSITPSNIFTFYTDNYKSKFIKEENIDGKTIQQIELKPIEDRNYAKVDLFVDEKEHMLTKVMIFDKNGGTITYTIDKFQSNLPAPDSEFTFKKADYPGVEVIDMR
jgi:outer membrane lipoprotein-sorting protein